MNRNLGPALVIALGLVVASVLIGGLYNSGTTADGTIIWKVNRFTGEVIVCVDAGAREGCHTITLSN